MEIHYETNKVPVEIVSADSPSVTEKIQVRLATDEELLKEAYSPLIGSRPSQYLAFR